MTARNNITGGAAGAMSTGDGSNVLHFPTKRKRAYPQCWVPKDELPSNVVRLEVGAFAPCEPLSESGLRWLVMAQLATMTFREQGRLHDKLHKWRQELPADHHSARGLANAQGLMRRMPCRAEDRDADRR